MANGKNIDIKKVSITKQEFKSALEKVGQKKDKTDKAVKNG